jgi:hypothetical protein
VRGDGNGVSADRAVRLRVDDAGEELAFDVPVSVVLDLVVGAARELAGDERPRLCVRSAGAGTLARRHAKGRTRAHTEQSLEAC